MRLIVCGGRAFAPMIVVWQNLDAIHARTPIDLLIHGNCPTGADAHAALWADSNGVQQKRFDVDWKAHGRGAGPRRNQQMADFGADAYLAFPGGDGTADMVRRAEKAGIPCLATDTCAR